MVTPLTEILRAPCGTEVYTPDGGHLPLYVSQRDWGRERIDASGPAEKVVLTQDGRGAFHGSWHREEEDGPEATEVVFFEVYAEIGRILHGWVDGRTRKVVQTG